MLELMLRGKLTRYFNGTIQYNLGRAYNNTGGINLRITRMFRQRFLFASIRVLHIRAIRVIGGVPNLLRFFENFFKSFPKI